jgi:hypothetical protein
VLSHALLFSLLVFYFVVVFHAYAGANVTGLTINQAQVNRAREITKTLSPWMQARCHFEVQDYLNVKVREREKRGVIGGWG